LKMVKSTLTAMRRGGIYDHVGYGFHRYSTDNKWLLPHFEKMLYDQAMLIIAYSEAYQATGISEFRETVEEIVSYVVRDLTDKDGGFYSAEDADSDGEEGRYYLWSVAEIEKTLGTNDADLFCGIFDCSAEGNFKDQASGERTGTNVIHMNQSWMEISERIELTEDKLKKFARSALDRLFSARQKRNRPFKDDKILTDWNGLMIAALSIASRASGNSKFTEYAKNAADFILGKMLSDDGRLSHRFRGGKAGIDGFIDDYAFLAYGLLELYQCTFDAKYLKYAVSISESMIELFYDDKIGGFYFTSKYSELLISRNTEYYDGALPSGYSIAVYTLLRLARLSERIDFQGVAEKAISNLALKIEKNPAAFACLLCAVGYAFGPSSEIVIAGDKADARIRTALDKINSSFRPDLMVALKSDTNDIADSELALSILKGKDRVNNQAAFYICRENACLPPITDVDEFLETALLK